MTSHRVFAVVLAACLCATANGAHDPALLAAVERLQRDQHIPGMTVAIVRADGTVVTAAAGSSAGVRARPLTSDDRMLAGSVGKTFVAAVVLDVFLEHEWSLDLPISRWFSAESWFERLPNAGSITVRMLLDHSSGLPDHVQDPRFAQALSDRRTLSHEDLLGFVLGEPALFAAGTGTRYTDTGYILLGLLIEMATGSTYEQQLRSRLLKPLALRDTIPSNRRELPGVIAGVGTTELGSEVDPAVEWTGGGIASTSRDLARWAWRLWRGTVSKRAYLPYMLAESGRPGGDGRYGLGVYIRHIEPWGIVYGHAGWFPGYRTLIAYLPDKGVSVAIQINTDAPHDLTAYAIELLASRRAE